MALRRLGPRDPQLAATGATRTMAIDEITTAHDEAIMSLYTQECADAPFDTCRSHP